MLAYVCRSSEVFRAVTLLAYVGSLRSCVLECVCVFKYVCGFGYAREPLRLAKPGRMEPSANADWEFYRLRFVRKALKASALSLSFAR